MEKFKVALFFCLFIGFNSYSAEVEQTKNLSFANSKLEVVPLVQLKKDLWQKDETIVFIHIPKTAGTNIVNLMDAIAIVNPDLKVKRASVPRTKDKSPNLFVESSIGGLQQIKDHASHYNGSKGHLDFISSHMPIPEEKDEEKYFGKQKISYVALIRDPIKRELSSANFDFQRSYIKQKDITYYLLKETIDNPQTRLLAGEDAMSGKCNEETLMRAKKNIIRRFKFVAPTEDLEIMMNILSSHFGIKNIAYARAQITGLKAIEKQEKFLYDGLAKKHKYDIELYNWAKMQWKRWKALNIESISNNIYYDSKAKYLTMLPDFVKTKKPEEMDIRQILEYNHNNKNELISFQQKHNASARKEVKIILE
ncbi:MAG: sulfotransferase family 2 domain-containing protein [Rickettsiales bacterium]